MANEVRFYTPIKLTYVNIDQFLKMALPIFECQNKMIKNVSFDTSTTIKADIIGLLLIYKFYEFTVRKSCFYKPKSTIRGYVKSELERRGLKELVDNFINYEKPQYNKLRFMSDDTLFISPIFLNIDSKTDEVEAASHNIRNYYKGNKDAQFLILTCMGEIAQNFKAHAENDTDSILSVTGDRNRFVIACVDTGVGIITSLTESYRVKSQDMPRAIALKKSLEKGVSSKDVSSGHMGYGLWLLTELVLSSKGEMRIYSEGHYVACHNGHIKYGNSSYWKGTIIYYSLPFTRFEVLKNTLEQIRPKHIKLNIKRS